MLEERKNRMATPDPDAVDETSEKKKKKKKDKHKGESSISSPTLDRPIEGYR